VLICSEKNVLTGCWWFGLFREKSAAGWWLTSQTNMTHSFALHIQVLCRIGIFCSFGERDIASCHDGILFVLRK
jgi:hypothetical protein